MINRKGILEFQTLVNHSALSTHMNDSPSLNCAIDLRESGKLREAYEAFCEAAAAAHEALPKAGILLNAAGTLTSY